MLVFKTATDSWEFEQIHQLNYRTFVEEIPQHQPDPSLRLVDRFHDQNTYVICVYRQHLLGMLAMRAQRPFSLDAKVANLDSHLPPYRRACEIRLLAVEVEHRQGRVFLGLLQEAWRHIDEWNCDLAVISGTVRQTRLYRHLGFAPFGPLVGRPGALYQPMYLTAAVFRETMRHLPARMTSMDMG